MNREHIVVEYRNGRKTLYLGSSAAPISSMQQYRQLEAVAKELSADLKDPNLKVRKWLMDIAGGITKDRIHLITNPPMTSTH